MHLAIGLPLYSMFLELLLRSTVPPEKGVLFYSSFPKVDWVPTLTLARPLPILFAYAV